MADAAEQSEVSITAAAAEGEAEEVPAIAKGKKRAAVGGEVGVNKEWYKGGQFISTTDMPKKLKENIRKAATGREQFEVGMGADKWSVPEPGMMPILGRTFGLRDWRKGEMRSHGMEYQKFSPEVIAELDRAAAAWKSGEKFIPVADYPLLAGYRDVARLINAGRPIPAGLIDRMPEPRRSELKQAAEKFKPEGPLTAAMAEAADELYQAVDEQWSKDFASWRKGTLPKQNIFNLGPASDELKLAGFPEGNVSVTQRVLREKSTDPKHPFPVEALSDLPKELRDPIAVFRSRTTGLVALTEISHKGENFVVAVHFQPDGNISEIHSIYPKNVSGVLDWIRDGLTTYYHKERAQNWLHRIARTNIQRAWNQQATPNVKTNDDVVKRPGGGTGEGPLTAAARKRLSARCRTSRRVSGKSSRRVVVMKRETGECLRISAKGWRVGQIFSTLRRRFGIHRCRHVRRRRKYHPDGSILHLHTHPIDQSFSDGDWRVFARNPIGGCVVGPIPSSSWSRPKFTDLPWRGRLQPSTRLTSTLIRYLTTSPRLGILTLSTAWLPKRRRAWPNNLAPNIQGGRFRGLH